MKQMVMVESIYNALDMGIYIESLKNALKTRFEMGAKEFMKYLIFGRGYDELTPPQLSRKIENFEQAPLIIDLREKHKFKTDHIKGAISHPFDDLLKDVLIYDGYAEYKERPIVLVCDTGHQSRVAAGILSDEGFIKVSSLKRGMRRWNRWDKLLYSCRQPRTMRFHFCKYMS
ncbi:MAG: rhodanese-like domain-containing protein [Deltaproteobacteria bacterium]|nr:rhodanese-like domain-containing protein [Deltaproteobacteria bacterium]